MTSDWVIRRLPDAGLLDMFGVLPPKHLGKLRTTFAGIPQSYEKVCKKVEIFGRICKKVVTEREFIRRPPLR